MSRQAQLELVMNMVRNLRTTIDTALPPGAVVPRHTDAGHFYGVPNGKVYPSVTGVLQSIKDPSIQQFDMNEALRYVESHIHEALKDGELDMMKVMDVLYEAKKAPKGVLVDAGDIGTQIHDKREEYFQDWIDSDKAEAPIIDMYYDRGTERADPRLISGMLALDKFCKENEYIPIRTEVMVYDDKYELAGMLDDIGVINTFVRKGDPNCDHDLWYDMLVTRCPKCDLKRQWHVALCDLKSSNQFKDSYFLQVAMYYMMFKNLTGITPDRSFILKVSKTDGTYKMEEMYKLRSLTAAAKRIVEAMLAVERVKAIRKASVTKKKINI